MKSLNAKQINSQLQTIAHSVTQAIDWVDNAREHSHRLNIEADSLRIKLYRCHHQLTALQCSPQSPPSIGFLGLSQTGKSHLIHALAANENERLEVHLAGRTLDFLTHINPGNQDCGIVTRFSRRKGIDNHDYPVELALLKEYEIAKMLVDAFLNDFSSEFDYQELDEGVIDEHLAALSTLRQPDIVAGLSEDDVVALWDAVNRRIGSRGKRLNRDFWPSAVRLAPYLSVDHRARLFSLLWNGVDELTSTYASFSHILQRLSCAEKVAVPLSVLVDDMQLPAEGILSPEVLENANSPLDFSVQVCPLINRKTAKPVELSIAELALLTFEITLPLAGAAREPLFQQTDVLDFPGMGRSLESEYEPSSSLNGILQRAKAQVLLERYADNQQLGALMVCTAVSEKTTTQSVGKILAHWAKSTLGDTEQRKPALIWALTPFDLRVTQNKSYDDAVQRYVGLPGESWGSMLVIDKSGVRRMVDYLATEVNSETNLRRLNLRLESLRRELADHLLGNWLALDEEKEEKEKLRISQTLLKALQTRTGVHGELLERLLPTRDELRGLYLQLNNQANSTVVSGNHSDNELPIMHGDPFGIEMNIDLVASIVPEEDSVTSEEQTEANFANQAYQYWINHLRNLAENRALLALLGLGKPELELLLQELITASVRMHIASALSHALSGTENEGARIDMLVDRQVSRVLSVLGDFVAWLGFQQIPESLRPDSRVNRGQKIFAKPPAMKTASWGNSLRLTKLSVTPSNNTGFYIYDWLVGLSEVIIQNKGYSAAHELNQQQQQQLKNIVTSIAD